MRTFAKKHKHHLSAWVVLVLLAIVSGYYGYIYSPQASSTQTDQLFDDQSEITVREATPEDDLERLSPTDQDSDENVYTSLDILDDIEVSEDVLADQKQDDHDDSDDHHTAELSEETDIIVVREGVGEPQVEQISASFYVEGKKYTLVYTKDSSVYEFMKELAAQGDFSFSGTNYGGQLGFFVDQVNSVRNADNFYWIYYINGEKAKMGISNYIPNDGDIITWNYEEAES